VAPPIFRGLVKPVWMDSVWYSSEAAHGAVRCCIETTCIGMGAALSLFWFADVFSTPERRHPPVSFVVEVGCRRRLFNLQEGLMISAVLEVAAGLTARLRW
jgi:hypothetical protein